MINLSINFLNDSDRFFTRCTRKAMDWAAALGKAATAITAGAMLACVAASFIAAPILTAAILTVALAQG